VIIFDDLIATGGTASAAVELIKSVGAEVVEALFIVEIAELKGKDKIGAKSYSVLSY
jgi:adenine phosphoribosyltransferase